MGAAFARALARRTTAIVAADLDLEAARRTAAAARGLAIGLDVCDPAMWTHALATARATADGPVLVVCVARAPEMTPETNDWSSIRLIHETNCLGGMLALRLAMDSLREPSASGLILRVGPGAWAPLAEAPARSAADQALRAHHAAMSGPARRAGLRTTLVTQGPFKPGGSPPSADETAAAALWAMDRGRSEIAVPDGWHARRWKARGAKGTALSLDGTGGT